ncbi:MAG: SAM-dependent methyltransferase [Lysobacterales bacterium]|jgi:SAM-dependent methyltransferase
MHCRVCTNQDVQVIDKIESPNCDSPVPVCHCRVCGHLSLFPTQYQQQKSFEWDGVDYYLQDAEHRKQAAAHVIDRLCTTYIKRNSKPPRTFLDAGCAIGLSLSLAEIRGLQAVGIEPEARLAEFGRTKLGVDIRHTKLNEAGLEAGSFDLIFCEQVLEHVSDPRQFLNSLKRLLAIGGQLYIGVPPVFALNRLSTIFMRKSGLALPGAVLSNIFHDPDEHINVFSRQSMRRLAQDCGLKLKILPLTLSTLKPGRVLKHLMAAGSNPGTFLLSHADPK